MAKTATVKKVKLKPFQKLLTVMISGKVVSKEEIENLLGDQIQMYRLSTYMWHIKTIANGAVKVVKDGRKAVGYQIVNVAEVKEYMRIAGVVTSKTEISVTKLEDLKAAELPKAVVTKPVPEKMTVTEITEG
jgi:DUF1009 family protein